MPGALVAGNGQIPVATPFTMENTCAKESRLIAAKVVK